MVTFIEEQDELAVEAGRAKLIELGSRYKEDREQFEKALASGAAVDPSRLEVVNALSREFERALRDHLVIEPDDGFRKVITEALVMSDWTLTLVLSGVPRR